jgi:hypothetical protein
MSRFIATRFLGLVAGAALISSVPGAPPYAQAATSARDVDLVIALDVSGSMTGLIASAKQRLWDIANELARVQPTPSLRVAILSYGRPSYGQESGYVRIDLPFTNDLDAVNETLFAFQTNGGDEFVARAIRTSLDALEWSARPEALRMIFVAGNESAEQDPLYSIAQVTHAAAERDIVVSAIYCGGESDPVAPGWQTVAFATNGTYASIDQDAAAVANISTPLDARLAELNEQLNATYIPFGDDGERAQENQLRQDANAAGMSAQSLASRVVTKGGALYRAAWDLVDAVAGGLALDEVDVEVLPAEMRVMAAAERESFVHEKAARRAELQAEIGSVAADRRAYIETERRANGEGTGLDEAILAGIRSAAEHKGFSLAE